MNKLTDKEARELWVLLQLRVALGDPTGELMQDELVERARDVCVPCPDEGIDDELCDANRIKVRSRGSPYIDQKRWSADDRELVFVVAA